ncbi:TPA: helix-turn-helix transcriptional regulator, partial [Escherichia coli]|nr:helix-turn-helix transcriptional regulator [Escherichia coli]
SWSHYLKIDELVNYSGYSKRYLQLLFKSKIGISVGKYIQLRRITRAATLLRFTNLSISNISARLLYDSQQTFTREFKKIVAIRLYNTENLKYGLLKI